MSSNLFDHPETATIEIIGMDKPSYGLFGALTHRHLTIIAGERITPSTAVSIEQLTGLDSLMRLRAELLGLQFVATGQRAT